MPTKTFPTFVAFFRFSGIACLLCFLTAPGAARAQAVNISSFSIAPNGTRQFGFPGEATNYYVLDRGATVTNLGTPVQAVFGAQPTTSMQDTNAQAGAAFYRVRTIATNAPADLDSDGVDDVAELIAGTNPLVANTPPGSLVINEVDYDQIGTDSGEFVEILNVSANPVSLANLRLVLINGNGSLQYNSIDLSTNGPSLAPGQYLVVKSATVAATNGALIFQFAAANDNVQNGAPDGLAIFDSASNVILDALSYEGSVTAATITGAPGTYNLVEGTVLAASVLDSNTVVGSLVRLPNGSDTNDANTDWKFTSTPTPGAANVP